MANEADIDADLDDSAMLSELKAWMDAARAAVAGHPKMRHVEIELGKINTIAEQLKAQARARLVRLEERYRPELQIKLVSGSLSEARSKSNARLDAYRRERQAVVAEFSERNDRLWRQRMVLTRDVLSVVERHEMKDVARARVMRPGAERSFGQGSNVSGGLMDRLRDRAKQLSAERDRGPEPDHGPEPDIGIER